VKITRRSSLLVVLIAGLVSAGCIDDVALIPEARAIELARGELAERAIQATDETHAITDLTVCPGAAGAADCETVSFTLDGWDPARHVGFEVVSDNDPDFGKGTRWSDLGETDHLQAAVDAALISSGEVVITIRQWSHETEALAESQFLSQLNLRLDALGL